MYLVSVEFCYQSTSVLSRMPFSDQLLYSPSILLQTESSVAVSVVNKMTTASLRYLSIWRADLDEVLNDQQIYTRLNALYFCVVVDSGCALDSENHLIVKHGSTGACFHRFYEFSQTITSVSITLWKHAGHVVYFFQKIPRRRKKESNSVTLIIKM